MECCIGANTENSPILQIKNLGKMARLAKNVSFHFVNEQMGLRKMQKVQHMQESALHVLLPLDF